MQISQDVLNEEILYSIDAKFKINAFKVNKTTLKITSNYFYGTGMVKLEQDKDFSYSDFMFKLLDIKNIEVEDFFKSSALYIYTEVNKKENIIIVPNIYMPEKAQRELIKAQDILKEKIIKEQRLEKQRQLEAKRAKEKVDTPPQKNTVIEKNESQVKSKPIVNELEKNDALPLNKSVEEEHKDISKHKEVKSITIEVTSINGTVKKTEVEIPEGKIRYDDLKNDKIFKEASTKDKSCPEQDKNIDNVDKKINSNKEVPVLKKEEIDNKNIKNNITAEDSKKTNNVFYDETRLKKLSLDEFEKIVIDLKKLRDEKKISEEEFKERRKNLIKNII